MFGGEAGPGAGQLCGEPRSDLEGTAADAVLVGSHAGYAAVGGVCDSEGLVCWK